VTLKERGDASLELQELSRLYQRWDEVRARHAEALARAASDEKSLRSDGSFLVGALKQATWARAEVQGSSGGSAGLQAAGESFHREASLRLKEAEGALSARLAEREEAFAAESSALQEEILKALSERVQRSPPRIVLSHHPVGESRSIMHAPRVSADEAIALAFVLAQKVPSRHAFLEDDSVEDATLAPASLYPDEGVTAAEVRPSLGRLKELLRSASAVLPIRGFIPVWLTAPEVLFRWVQRGPVLEAEVEEGEGFRHLLSREEAERFAGELLRLKLLGKLNLEIRLGDTGNTEST
jgi:hypothetical protein